MDTNGNNEVGVCDVAVTEKSEVPVKKFAPLEKKTCLMVLGKVQDYCSFYGYSKNSQAL